MSHSLAETLLRPQHELADFPHPEFGEPVKFGEALTMVSHPFAYPLDNRSLLEFAINLGLPSSDAIVAEQIIATTGFTNRFISHHPDEILSPENSLDRASQVGTLLLKEVLSAHGWRDVDVFIDTSAFLPTSLNCAILERAGLDSNRVYSRSYRYACAGAMAAFIDCLSDPNLQDARIVIAAIEPLSQLINRDPYITLKDLTIPAIFGDANTALAFSPRHFHLEAARVLIQPDNGVIKLKTQYDYPTTSPAMPSAPPHYRFANQGENILHYSDTEATLHISPPPGSSPISMDGIRTGLFFGDQTTSVIIEMLNEYGHPDLLNLLGDKNVILHPASRPVVDRIAKLLHRQKYLDTPKLPFLMDLAHQPNGSSATTLNRWRYMIQNDLIDPSLPMLWIAPGVGSAIAGAIGWIKP